MLLTQGASDGTLTRPLTLELGHQVVANTTRVSVLIGARACIDGLPRASYVLPEWAERVSGFGYIPQQGMSGASAKSTE